jgi:hypothetical protein
MEWKSVCLLHLCHSHPSRDSPAGTRLGHASDRGCSAAICRISETPNSRKKIARVIDRDPKIHPTATPLPKPTQVPAGLAAFTASCGLPPSSSYRRLSLRDIILVYSKARLWESLLRFLRLHPHKFFHLLFNLTIINPHCVLVHRTFSNLCFGYLCLFRRALPLSFSATTLRIFPGMPIIEEVSAGSMSSPRKHLSARGRRFSRSKGLVEPLLGHRKLCFVLGCEG